MIKLKKKILKGNAGLEGDYHEKCECCKGFFDDKCNDTDVDHKDHEHKKSNGNVDLEELVIYSTIKDDNRELEKLGD